MGAGTVTVLGATGKTGRAVVAAALRRGLTVRATSRDPGHGAPAVVTSGGPDGTRSPQATGDPRLSWHRADVVTGEGLADALTGADAAYLIVPNVHPAEVEAVELATRAATEAGVERLVYHSVADPDDARMAHHLRKGAAERAVRRLRPDAVVLRPCAYLQNLLPSAVAGHLEVPYRLSAPFSLVDLDDVAEVAAAALDGRLEPGSTHDLGGPEVLSVLQLAEVAVTVLGRPVSASAVTPEQWRSGPGAGVDGSALEDLLAMFAAYDQSGFTVDPAPLARLLGRPPTTWAQLLTKESS
ncbi:SDR family oxidoreductase [Ornithinimicrobium pekingense]|uniref:Nucleotide-diphosphate-sugar epimerase n=1 Tax=Ornithinimicrobium pekingense TaxID=384677 RepID=A0ABQ2FBI9_9MICO|nr:NmrA family NAD(P)-binding protein [Ornithinimicrobium pekingense]GGK80821.1 nucleotide-diphosphate-sugar epimerase [Ornithinimicrobium pekingense]